MVAMTWQLIALDDIPATPWRNGGGRTRELLAWPTASDWRWRISVAEVANAGPFSCFAGVRRWLVILGGAGVRLEFADRVIELSPASAPLNFDGADAIQCSLCDGPVQDLNLMVRGPGVMQRVDGFARYFVAAGNVVALFASTAAASIFVAGERTAVPVGTLAWRQLAEPVQIDIEARQAYCMCIGSGPLVELAASIDP